MDGSIDDIRLFLAVAEGESFSAAARSLGVGQATVSRRVAALEERLGRALFERGRAGAVVTATGLALLPAAREVARWCAEFERQAIGREDPVEGRVRIAAPPGIAAEVLAPFAAELARRAPALRLEVLAGIEYIDLLRGAADLAIRTRPPVEPELVALAEVEVQVGVYAAHSYAETLTDEVTWSDLDWISWTGIHRELPPRPQLERMIPEFQPSFASDDYLVQLEALRAGLGCMLLGVPDQRRPDAETLVRIDLGVELPAACWHLVCTRSGRLAPRVRAVADQLRAWLEESALIAGRS